MLILQCEACGKEFKRFPKDARRIKHQFCSKECASRPIIPAECIECGAQFLVPARGARDATFCSVACRNARNRREQIHKRGKLITKACEHCNKPFQVRHSIAKVQRYCSQTCSGAAMGTQRTGTSNVNWKPKIDIVCDYCGTQFQTYPSRAGRRKYCCQEHRILGHLRRLAKGGRTNLEIKMANALSRHKIAFEEQIVMFGKFMVDFKLKDSPIIVQCDGLYWHNQPKTKARDKGQDRHLAKSGYIVLRFDDHQILNEIDNCIKRIKTTIESHQIPLLHY